MRLTPTEISAIQNHSRHFWGKAVSVWLFGSRVDDSKRGGDIDLLVLSKNEDERIRFLKEEINFLIALKNDIGDQKIDVVFATPTIMENNPFCRTLGVTIPLTGVHLVRLTPELLTAFRIFHQEVGGGCFCAVWNSYDDSWQERCNTDAGASNLEHITKDVRAGRRCGFFLFQEGRVVAWTASGPKSDFPYLSQKLGSRLTSSDTTRWSIGCMTVHPSMRGQGLQDILLDCVCEHARANGAADIEGYPVVPSDKQRAYRGSARLFIRHGFQKVASEFDDEDEFPVMRFSFSLQSKV